MAEWQAKHSKAALVPRRVNPNFCQPGPRYRFYNCAQWTLDVCNYDRYKDNLLACQIIRAFILLALVVLLLLWMTYTIHRNRSRYGT